MESGKQTARKKCPKDRLPNTPSPCLQCTWATREPCKVMPDDLALQESQVSQSIKQGLPGTWVLDNLDTQCPALTARVHSNTADSGARTQRPSNRHYARSTSNTQHPTTAQAAINQSTNRLAHQVTKTKQPRNKATNQQPNQSANQTTTASPITQINTNFCIVGLVTITEVSGNVFFNELQGKIQGNLASKVRHELEAIHVTSQPKLPQTPKRFDKSFEKKTYAPCMEYLPTFIINVW